MSFYGCLLQIGVIFLTILNEEGAGKMKMKLCKLNSPVLG